MIFCIAILLIIAGSDSKMFKGVYPMRNIPVHEKNLVKKT